MQGGYRSHNAEDGQNSDDLLRFDTDLNWQQDFGSLQPQRNTTPAARQAAQRARQRQEKRKGSPGRAAFYTFLTVLFLGVSAVILVMLLPQLRGVLWTDLDNYCFINGELVRYDREKANTYKQYAAYVDQDVIYPGVFIDGTHVGGMTVAQAETLLNQNAPDLSNAFDVTVSIGDKTWKATPENIPVERSFGNVLQQAYAIGRSLSADTTGESVFEKRASAALHLREDGVNLTTETVYDHEAVRTLVTQIADYINRDPVDAQIASFDFNRRKFTFTESSPGISIDEDELYLKLCSALDQWKKGLTVSVSPIIVEPEITTEALSEGYCMISAFTTSTTSDSDRNTNIRLACEAINGTCLMPGETFSFNSTTGERTTAKGYKAAGAISAGQSIEEVGGGICQVSSTIFNAVARANLEIVSRSPHAWPSSYVNIGEDATVNWPNLDFKFKNNTDTPVFLITYYKNRKLSCEVWGMTLGKGVTIDLQSTVTKTTKAPTEISYVYNASLPYGTDKTTVKARDGYVVDTYKIWYQDGVETKREKMYTSTYKAYQQVIEYNYEMNN